MFLKGNDILNRLVVVRKVGALWLSSYSHFSVGLADESDGWE